MPDDRALEDIREKLLWTPPNADPSRVAGVFMDLNTKCNLRCGTCGFSDPRLDGHRGYDMPAWLFDKIAVDVFPRASYVCLSVLAEPMMTRDVAARVTTLANHAVPFTEITTNATLLTHPIAEALIGLTRVNVSIDGGTRELFEAARPGARFDAVIANWWLLKRVRGTSALPKLRINHVLTPNNIAHFDTFLDLAHELGADELSVRPLTRLGNSVVNDTSDPAFWDAVRDARRKLEQCGIADTGFMRDRWSVIDLRMTCSYPWRFLSIHPNGEVFPCFGWSRPALGNFVTDDFDEVWNGDGFRSIREEFARTRPGVDCTHCEARRGRDDAGDDVFFRNIMKTPPPLVAPT